jgi:hypothetical protein
LKLTVKQNFVAAISALSGAIPLQQRLNPSDLFLATDSFTNTYTLCLTLAALFSHASIAINSVAGPGVKLALAARSIAPTVVVASAETAAHLHAESSPHVAGGLKKILHGLQTSALDAGRMPADSLLTKLHAPHRTAIGTTPGKLRLLFVSERAGAEAPPLSSHDLSDIRVFTGARIAYALTDAKVAGAVAQTSIYDYRREGTAKNKHSHFGAPLSSVEIKLVDTERLKTTDEAAKGEVRLLVSILISDVADRLCRLLSVVQQSPMVTLNWVSQGHSETTTRWHIYNSRHNPECRKYLYEHNPTLS